MQEYLSGIAAILGVLLTAIATFFGYRKSEAKREQQIAAGARSGIIGATAGLALSELNSKLYVEELNQLTGAVNRLAMSNERLSLVHEAAIKTEREKVEPLERASKETVRMREALEDIANAVRAREKRERGE